MSAAAWRWGGGGSRVSGGGSSTKLGDGAKRDGGLPGGSSTEATVDPPAPSANALTHAPSNATDTPTYASSSLVEDGGTTVPTASLSSAAMAASVATSTAVADAPPPPTMPMPTPTLN